MGRRSQASRCVEKCGFEENVIDTVDVDEFSDAEEEVQNVAASEVKSVPVSAQL